MSFDACTDVMCQCIVTYVNLLWVFFLCLDKNNPENQNLFDFFYVFRPKIYFSMYIQR